MVGMYNLKYIEGIQTRIHTSVRIQLDPSMVVILCPPPLSSLSLMLPLLFYCCYRRSEFKTEFRLKFQSRDQDCLGARYVVHLWCTVHSVNSEIRTASKPEMLFTCGAQYIHVVLLSCFLSSPGITDRERSAGSALTSCTVTVHLLPPVPSQCIRLCSYLLGSSPVCCSVQCWRSRNAQNEVGSRSEVGSIQRI